MHKRNLITIVMLILIIFSGCSKNIVYNVPLFEYPIDWKDAEARSKTITDYSKYLEGRKIFLDPGHGGEDRRNKSKNGEVIEADVNLRVALVLKTYLEQAGAQVVISRDKDTTVQLGYRSVLANNSGAELFISVHHNAPGKTEDDYTNYTSVYYHAKETDYEHEPSNKDLARYIERDLSYVMGNPHGLGSFDGTYSDYNIYPGEGFSVLRKTNIQAVLIEGAFHTSRLEEMRLNNEEFNQIQAWGIFRGIAKYFKAGIPQVELLTDSLKNDNNSLKLAFQLKDEQKIDPRSITLWINKVEKEFSFNKATNVVSTQIDSLKVGEYEVKLVAANINGNHNRKFIKKIIVKENNEIEIKE